LTSRHQGTSPWISLPAESEPLPHFRQAKLPLKAAGTCAATHDTNNNSLKPIEAGAENKSAVQQLTKRIPSGNGNFTVKEIIPETSLKAHQICSMQEMVVKYD